MSNQPPIEVPQGAIRLNTDSQKLEFFAEDRWYQFAINTPVLDGGARGLVLWWNVPVVKQWYQINYNRNVRKCDRFC